MMQKPPNLNLFEKWKNDLEIILHPTRLSILIILQAAEVIETERVKKIVTADFPKGFLNCYLKMIQSAVCIAQSGFTRLLSDLLVWPMRFFVLRKTKRDIPLPSPVAIYILYMNKV